MLSQLSIINLQLIWFSYSTNRKMFFSFSVPRISLWDLNVRVCLLFLAWNLRLSPDLSGKCFAILTNFSEIRECSCVHTELKLISFHAFCTKPVEATRAIVSSSLVIVAVVWHEEEWGSCPASARLLDNDCPGAALPDAAGIWGAFLKHLPKISFVVDNPQAAVDADKACTRWKLSCPVHSWALAWKSSQQQQGRGCRAQLLWEYPQGTGCWVE